MRTEEEIREKIKSLRFYAEEEYKMGYFMEMENAEKMAYILKWVLEEGDD